MSAQFYGLEETLEHLNFCRQIVKQANALLLVPSLDQMQRALWTHLVDLCAASQKFLLPDNGEYLEDNDLRALDEAMELKLPFPMIALEYRNTEPTEAGLERSSKRVIFAREHDDYIACSTAIWADAQGVWTPYFAFRVNKRNYLRRTDAGTYIEFSAAQSLGQEEMLDIHAEASTLMRFLNVLACTNVGVERSEPKNSGRKVKTALPFDTYHLLALKTGAAASGAETCGQGGGRTPREHLRRGHIRRLHDGRKVWVRATVVSAGRGAGVVSKDYALRGAA